MRGGFILFLGASGRYAADGEEDFVKTIRPLLKERCISCHSTEKQKGDLDLEQFKSLPEIHRHPKVWQGVVEQLDNGEMPPKDKPQPTSLERSRLRSWVQSVLNQIALAKAGDPGPVILRRLSNAEYTYTLRDRPGIESLNTDRDCSVDDAAGVGFLSTAGGLMCDPSLRTMYLDPVRDLSGLW